MSKRKHSSTSASMDGLPEDPGDLLTAHKPRPATLTSAQAPPPPRGYAAPPFQPHDFPPMPPIAVPSLHVSGAPRVQRPQVQAPAAAAAPPRQEEDERSWQTMLRQVTAFKRANGHVNIPYAENGLGRWVYDAKRQVRRGEMSQSRIRELRAAGLDLGHTVKYDWADQQWNNRYQALVSYREEHGDCHVITSGPNVTDIQLANFVKKQRELYRRGELFADRLSKLKSIGFEFQPSRLPKQPTTALGRFQRAQELRAERKKLEREFRAQKLGLDVTAASVHSSTDDADEDDLGVEDYADNVADDDADEEPLPEYDDYSNSRSFTSEEIRWDFFFTKLQEYKQQYGDCLVSVIGPNRCDPQLVAWVKQQRYAFSKGSMLPSRQKRLEDVEFVFKPHKMRPQPQQKLASTGGSAATAPAPAEQAAVEKVKPIPQPEKAEQTKAPLPAKEEPPPPPAKQGPEPPREDEKGQAQLATQPPSQEVLPTAKPPAKPPATEQRSTAQSADQEPEMAETEQLTPRSLFDDEPPGTKEAPPTKEPLREAPSAEQPHETLPDIMSQETAADEVQPLKTAPNVEQLKAPESDEQPQETPAADESQVKREVLDDDKPSEAEYEPQAIQDDDGTDDVFMEVMEEEAQQLEEPDQVEKRQPKQEDIDLDLAENVLQLADPKPEEEAQPEPQDSAGKEDVDMTPAETEPHIVEPKRKAETTPSRQDDSGNVDTNVEPVNKALQQPAAKREEEALPTQDASFKENVVMEAVEEVIMTAEEDDLPPDELEWQSMYKRLEAYKQEHGDTMVVTSGANVIDQRLGSWVKKQRLLYRHEELLPERAERLSDLGFVFQPSRIPKRKKNADEDVDVPPVEVKSSGGQDDGSDDLEWQGMFKKLQSYKRKNGDCMVVTSGANVTEPRLGAWVKKQRTLFRNGELSPEREEQLLDLGFVFRPSLTPKKMSQREVEEDDDEEEQEGKEADDGDEIPRDELEWQGMFKKLRLYKRKHGDCMVVTSGANVIDPKLGYWVKRQRKVFRNGELLPEREEQLSELGFVFRPLTTPNKKSNAEEEEEEEGSDDDEEEEEGDDDDDEEEEEEESGIPPDEDEWQGMFKKLQSYKRKYGDCMVVTSGANVIDRPLGYWVKNQRTHYRHGKLSTERKRLLSKLGFVLQPSLLVPKKELQESGEDDSAEVDGDPPDELEWQGMFKKLQSYKRKHGDCMVVTSGANVVDQRLGAWVKMQRTHYRKGRLLPEREGKLLELGFVFQPSRMPKKVDEDEDEEDSDEGVEVPRDEEEWQAMYKKLEAYKRKHGDCLVITSGPNVIDQQLGYWVKKQRNHHTHRKLFRDRERKLTKLGFVFRPSAVKGIPHKKAAKTKDADESDEVDSEDEEEEESDEEESEAHTPRDNEQWSRMFDKMKAYKKKHGDCLVITSGANVIDSQLASWVKKQRSLYVHDNLLPERLEKLEKLGFVFQPSKVKGIPHKKHGQSFDVPTNDDPEEEVGEEIEEDEEEEDDDDDDDDGDDLEEERVNKNDYGGEKFWEKMFEKLVAYKKKHGDVNVVTSGPNVLDSQLALWVKKQRALLKKGRLLPERRGKLEALDFDFRPSRSKSSSDPSPPLKKPTRAAAQKATPDESKAERRQSIEHLGDDQWGRMFKRLADYKRKHGDCLVVTSGPNVEDPLLASWVKKQRELFSRGSILDSRVERLESVGFVFQPSLRLKSRSSAGSVSSQKSNKKELPRDSASLTSGANLPWSELFDRLKAHKRKHGHCNVITSGPNVDDTHLASWVKKQREQFRRRRLPEDRMNKLASVGFEFNPNKKRSSLQHQEAPPAKRRALSPPPDDGSVDDGSNANQGHWEGQWGKMYSRLMEHKRKYGHVQVRTSGRNVVDPALARWTKRQREKYAKGKLPFERKAKLESLGFQFRLKPRKKIARPVPAISSATILRRDKLQQKDMIEVATSESEADSGPDEEESEAEPELSLLAAASNWEPEHDVMMSDDDVDQQERSQQQATPHVSSLDEDDGVPSSVQKAEKRTKRLGFGL